MEPHGSLYILDWTALLLVLLCWSPCLQTADTALQTLGFSSCQHRLARASQLALTHVRSRLQCARDCAKMADCQVAQTRGDKSGGLLECRLLTNVTSSSDCNNWTEQMGTRAMVKKYSMCGIRGVNVSGTCQCQPFTYGSSCENIIPDCWNKAVFTLANTGVGLIKPSTFPEPARAFCNFESNVLGVILRDSTAPGPPVLFNRSWDEYKNGFGDNSNFWFGLENLYNMMRYKSTLRLEFYVGYSGGSAVGVYNGFGLEGASTGYRLTFTSFTSTNSYVKSGMQSGRPFCTYDRDCNNCSKQHQGAGWWYGPNCETGGVTYPQDQIWWPKSDGTTLRPTTLAFQLTGL